MFSVYLITPVALLWTLNLVCLFQMSAILQLRVYLGWVGQKDYSYVLEKTLLYLHIHFYTLFSQQWNATDSCLVCDPPNFHSLFSLAHVASPAIPHALWLFLTKDKLLHKTLQTPSLLVFLEAVSVKKHSKFDSCLSGCLKPISAWWHLQAKCPRALTCHLSHSWHTLTNTCGVPTWMTVFSTLSSKISSTSILHPQDKLSKFCFSTNGLKQEENSFWKDSSLEHKETKTRYCKCTRRSQTSEEYILENQIPVKASEAKKNPACKQCCLDSEVTA